MEALNARLYGPDAPHEIRSASQRDSDRILYSYAFQRLAGITQVTGTEGGEILHSRLTHSLKVAQVARRLCERFVQQSPGFATMLGLDPDAAEAAALAHDLGHPPFGHVAEHALDKLAADWGGFNGNAQSFRIVTQLENKRIDWNGLDLSRRTLLGLLKYPWLRDPSTPARAKSWGAYETERDYFEWVMDGRVIGVRHGLAEIMDWADDVTYAVHDVEDFFRAGLVPLDRLGASEIHSDRARLIEAAADRGEWSVEELEEPAAELFEADLIWDRHWVSSSGDRRQLHSDMSTLLEQFIEAFDLDTDGQRVIDRHIQMKVALLKALAWVYVIDRPALKAVQTGQEIVISTIHGYFLKQLDKAPGEKPAVRYRAFPRMFRDLLTELDAPESEDAKRVVTDVVASMTEDTAYHLYARITGAESGSILDSIARSVR